MNFSEEIYIMIQARSSSSRLPGKVFLNLPGDIEKSVIETIFDRCLESGFPVQILVPEKDELEQYLIKRKLPCITGSLEDVRERYRKAARLCNAKAIVRVTGDNPFVDPELIQKTVSRFLEFQSYAAVDLFSFTGLPLGMGVEIFSVQALNKDTIDMAEYREHVSLHIKHSNDFVVLHEDYPSPWLRVKDKPRLTIDEKADYDTVRAILERFSVKFSQPPGIENLYELFCQEPELFFGNSHVTQISFTKPSSVAAANSLPGKMRERVLILYSAEGTGHQYRMEKLYEELKSKSLSEFEPLIQAAEIKDNRIPLENRISDLAAGSVLVLDMRDIDPRPFLKYGPVIAIDNQYFGRKNIVREFPDSLLFFDTLAHPGADENWPVQCLIGNDLIQKTNEITKGRPRLKKFQNHVQRIMVYAGQPGFLARKELKDIDRMMVESGISSLRIGGYPPIEAGIDFYRELARKEFLDEMLQAEIFISYSGLALHEAWYAGLLPVLIPTRHTVHRELADFLQCLGLPVYEKLFAEHLFSDEQYIKIQEVLKSNRPTGQGYGVLINEIDRMRRLPVVNHSCI